MASRRSFFFFFNDTATTEIYTLSLHDALPICHRLGPAHAVDGGQRTGVAVQRLPHGPGRSEEHTSELQSPCNLVCRLLLEKKKSKLRGASIWRCQIHNSAAALRVAAQSSVGPH